MQAARAVKEALAIKRSYWDVEIYNFVRLASTWLDGLSREFYLSVVRHFPSCYGWFYRVTDTVRPNRRYILDWFGRVAIERLMQDYAPQVLVATFPTPGRVAADLKLRRRLATPVVMVVTDHTVHAEWIHPGVDLYVVADEEVQENLLERRVRPEQVVVAGVPIRLAFASLPDRLETRKRLGFSQQEPVVLVTGGGHGGVAALEEICRIFAGASLRVKVVVVTGNDRALYARLSARYGTKTEFRVLGYAANIAELMRAADLLVGKAGALTLAEAAAAELPVIIYRPLPGQEEANARYYERRGMAIRARTAADLVKLAGQILTDEGGAGTRLRTAARSVARPQAALVAAAAIGRLVETGGGNGARDKGR